MFLLAVAPTAGFGQDSRNRLQPPPDIQRALDRLGSSRFAEREAATRDLIAQEAARPFLEIYARSSDPEVASRARHILAAHDGRYAPVRMRRLFRYGHDGQIERMVEGLAQWAGPIESDELWDGLTRVLTALERKSPQVYRARSDRLDIPAISLPGNLRDIFRKKKIAPNYHRLTDRLAGDTHLGLITSHGWPITGRRLSTSVIVSTGPVSSQTWIKGSVILSTGDVICGDSTDSVSGAIIVSGGRVVLRGQVSSALVIAREGIDVTQCKTRPDWHLVSSGKIDGAADDPGGVRNPRVESGQAEPLGHVRWFDSSSVGFESDPKKGGHQVTALGRETPAVRAGLAVGDLITAIDGVPVQESAAGFRVQLRAASVHDICVLRVVRDGQPRSIVLDFRPDGK